MMHGFDARQHILLVGGFGESPFLRNSLKDVFGQQGTEVITIEQPSYEFNFTRLMEY
jgi:hypothetical protein